LHNTTGVPYIISELFPPFRVYRVDSARTSLPQDRPDLSLRRTTSILYPTTIDDTDNILNLGCRGANPSNPQTSSCEHRRALLRSIACIFPARPDDRIAIFAASDKTSLIIASKLDWSRCRKGRCVAPLSSCLPWIRIGVLCQEHTEHTPTPLSEFGLMGLAKVEVVLQIDKVPSAGGFARHISRQSRQRRQTLSLSGGT